MIYIYCICINFKVVKTFIDNVKQKAAGEKVYDSITPGQQFVKIVLDELISFLSSVLLSFSAKFLLEVIKSEVI